MSELRFTLYIAGQTTRSERAISNLRQICEQSLAREYSLEVVDVLERPEVAESERILTTPTLVKESPPPPRRLVGDLSDKEKVLLGLNLTARERTEDLGESGA
jgi:circadian clock protein KaiB